MHNISFEGRQQMKMMKRLKEQMAALQEAAEERARQAEKEKEKQLMLENEEGNGGGGKTNSNEDDDDEAAEREYNMHNARKK